MQNTEMGNGKGEKIPNNEEEKGNSIALTLFRYYDNEGKNEIELDSVKAIFYQLTRKTISSKGLDKYIKTTGATDTITFNDFLPLYQNFVQAKNIVPTNELLKQIELEKSLSFTALLECDEIKDDNNSNNTQTNNIENNIENNHKNVNDMDKNLNRLKDRSTLKSSHSHGQVTITRVKSNVNDDANRRKVFVLYTGGTMGMRCDESGSLRPDPGYLTEQIFNMPEVQSNSMPTITIIEYLQLIDSSDMNATDWVRIVKDIEDNYYDYDGFVIIMGTDSMAYAASAVSFMIQNLAKPVVFTGSMIPFFEVYNDARRNFLTSLLIAGNVEIPEVCIFFNSKLIRGNRATKIASDSLDAFDSPNYPPLARLGVGLAIEEWAVRPQPKGRFRANYNMPMKAVTVLKMVPGFDESLLTLIVKHLISPSERKVLVLELFGVGNLPSRSDAIFDILREGQSKGLLIVATSQCLSGRVELGDYAVAKKLKSCGVISAHDMTIEAIVTKLAYLIGKGISNDDIKHWMCEEIRGELSRHRRFSTATLVSATIAGTSKH